MSVLRFLIFIIHCIVLSLLMGTFLNAYIPPSILPQVNFLSLAYPILFIIHILLCLLWILMWKKRAFIFLSASLFFIHPIQRWLNFTPIPEGKSTLKAISFNAYDGKISKEKIVQFIETEQPDIFFVQEGFYLNRENPFKDYYKSKDDDLMHIFSKHPIIESGVIYIENYLVGKSIYIDINYKGTPLRLVNFYLEPFRLDTQEKQIDNINKNYIDKFINNFKLHQRQVKIIQRFIKDSKIPVIVAGDMNAVPNSYEYYHLSDGLIDSFQVAGRGIGTTFHETIVPIKIDYIFSSKNIKPIICQVFRKEQLSDHSPVIAEFTVE